MQYYKFHGFITECFIAVMRSTIRSLIRLCLAIGITAFHMLGFAIPLMSFFTHSYLKTDGCFAIDTALTLALFSIVCFIMHAILVSTTLKAIHYPLIRSCLIIGILFSYMIVLVIADNDVKGSIGQLIFLPGFVLLLTLCVIEWSTSLLIFFSRIRYSVFIYGYKLYS